MTDTTTPTTPLEIPDKALTALVDTGADVWNDDEEIAEDARSIAAPVVAAELRRLADEIRADALELSDNGMLSASEQNVYARIVRNLRVRADEIEHATT